MVTGGGGLVGSIDTGDQYGIGRIGIIQFLQPVVGVTLAVILLGDSLTVPLSIGAVAILGGVFIARRR